MVKLNCLVKHLLIYHDLYDLISTQVNNTKVKFEICKTVQMLYCQMLVRRRFLRWAKNASYGH